MKFKKLAIVFAALLLLFGITNQSFAAISKLNMVQGGDRYIYSNDPESISSSTLGSTGGKFTIEKSLDANYQYEAEFYHSNYSGGPLRIGIAIQNNNSTAKSIRVRNKALAYGTSPYTSVASTVLRDYGNSTNDQYISVPANSSIFLFYSDVPGGNVVNGKIKFVPTASNMKIRVFFAQTSKTAYQIFGLPKAASDGKNRTTGFFMTDTRYANVDASTVSSFYLSAYDDNYNEYEIGSDVLGSSKLLGNYGITYDLQLT